LIDALICRLFDNLVVAYFFGPPCVCSTSETVNFRLFDLYFASRRITISCYEYNHYSQIYARIEWQYLRCTVDIGFKS